MDGVRRVVQAKKIKGGFGAAACLVLFVVILRLSPAFAHHHPTRAVPKIGNVKKEKDFLSVCLRAKCCATFFKSESLARAESAGRFWRKCVKRRHAQGHAPTRREAHVALHGRHAASTRHLAADFDCSRQVFECVGFGHYFEQPGRL